MIDGKSILEAGNCTQSARVRQREASKLTKAISNNVDDEHSNEIFDKVKKSIWWRHFLAGGMAGALSRTSTAPMDRLKIYSQVHVHSMSLYKLLKFLVQRGGVLSLWRGNCVNVMKVMPESAIKFTAYEKFKRMIRGNDLRDLSIQERFIAGACTGAIAQSIIYPLEVLKVRLALGMANKVDSVRYVARNMYLHEGLRSFYRGYTPNIMGSIPYSGIELTIYEGLKRKHKSYLEVGEEPNFFMFCVFSSVSAITGQCCVYPFTLVRTRLQSGLMGNEKILTIFRNILKSEGPKGLYRGLVPNICKVIPAVSINFVVYEYVSRYLGIYMT